MRRKRSGSDITLFDADRPLILQIDAKDIKGAKRGDEMHCAAANALCRKKGVTKAMVCKTKTYVWYGDDVVERFITPKALRTEIMIFDRNGEMEGGEYRLMPPKGGQKLGSRYKPTGPKLTTAKVKAPAHVIHNVRANAPKGNNLARTLKDMK